jgi:hypothetical protein
MSVKLSADDLLAGSQQKYPITVPADVLPEGTQAAGGQVLLKPLTVSDVQRIGKAAKDQGLLTSVLMVHQALVEPEMTVEQVGKLPAGLAQFLLGEVNRVSGLSLSEDDLQHAVKAPLTKATFVLSREFGWTPAQCSELTLGQVLLYLEMLSGDTPDQENVA